MASNRTQQALARLADLTPRQIVAELDRFIVGQGEAKKAVAIALRNRWRRQRAPESIREEISPNNIILIGPTGVGKTEIARRLARLAGAPFVKVEASKFTEVGYVGRDVESMVRDLVEQSVNMVKTQKKEEVKQRAAEIGQVARIGKHRHVARSGVGERDVRDTFLRPNERQDLAIRVELHVEPLLHPCADRLAERRQSELERIAAHLWLRRGIPQ